MRVKDSVEKELSTWSEAYGGTYNIVAQINLSAKNH